ncbi:MAG: polysaccharide pyruvyl transferase family protein [Lachnospiraceae bacterium]|jgi:colanic acid/amylovoran biosynthesis protein|nr:polysaccharide pyruvyl transferase family protein [Lachnospiraceae bacterium]
MKKDKILLAGATLSGNLGGHALYMSFVKEYEKLFGKTEVTVLSKYFKDDKKEALKQGWKIVNYSTLYQLTYGMFFYCIGGTLKKFHMPYKWLAIGRLKAYKEADILVDLSGISFTDDRSISGLIINTLWFLPAIILDKPMIKVSQSMGPFETKIVRTVSKYMLEKMDIIIARGEISYHYVKNLLPNKRIYNLPDVAFCLRPRKLNMDKFGSKYGISLEFGYIAVGPSTVVEELMGEDKYIGLFKALVEKAYDLSKLPIILVPHSRGHSKHIGVNSIRDDISTCKKIASCLSNKIPVFITETNVKSDEIKGIISKAEIAVGSRYHFLIGAISSGVPSLSVAWSHKYQEAFREVGGNRMEKYVMKYQDVNCFKACSLLEELWICRETLRQSMNHKLPEVIENARRNVKLAHSLITKV